MKLKIFKQLFIIGFFIFAQTTFSMISENMKRGNPSSFGKEIPTLFHLCSKIWAVELAHRLMADIKAGLGSPWFEPTVLPASFLEEVKFALFDYYPNEMANAIKDIESDLCIKTLGGQTTNGHENSITSLAISSDEKFIVSGSCDCSIKIWDIKSGQCLKTIGHQAANGQHTNQHKHFVTSVVISKDDKFIISGSYDGTIKIWDFQTGCCLKTLRGHEGSVNSVEISCDKKFIVSGGADQTIKIWDFQAMGEPGGDCLKTLEGHQDQVKKVLITLNNRFVVSGANDGLIKVWDLGTGECINTIKSDFTGVYSLEIDTLSRFVIAAGRYDNTIKIWDLENGNRTECGDPLKTIYCHKGCSSLIALSPDNKFIVSGGCLGNILSISNIKTGNRLINFIAHKGAISSIAISPKGNFIVTGSDDKTIKIWAINLNQNLTEILKKIRKLSAKNAYKIGNLFDKKSFCKLS